MILSKIFRFLLIIPLTLTSALTLKSAFILPQIVRENPYNTMHTVRWILYDTEFEIEKDYGKDDVYFNYGNFKTFREIPENKLTVFNYNFEKLYKEEYQKNIMD